MGDFKQGSVNPALDVASARARQVAQSAQDRGSRIGVRGHAELFGNNWVQNHAELFGNKQSSMTPSPRPVLDLLVATDDQAVGGLLYNGNSSRRTHANNVYSAVNQTGDIG